MGKIARFTQKIFGASAGTNQVSQFGSYEAGTPVFSTVPATIMGLAQYASGWFSAVVGANAPAMEDMNALHFVETTQLAYLCQAGIPEYDVGTTYYTGSLCMNAGKIFISLQDNNLNQPLLATSSFWQNYVPVLNIGNSSVNVTLTSINDFLLCQASAGVFTVTLPSAVGIAGKILILKKTDSTFNAVTVATQSLQTIDTIYSTTTLNSQNETLTLISDGSNWNIISRRVPSIWTSISGTVPTALPSWTAQNTVLTYSRMGSGLSMTMNISVTGSCSGPLVVSLPFGLNVATSSLVVGSGIVGSGLIINSGSYIPLRVLLQSNSPGAVQLYTEFSNGSGSPVTITNLTATNSAVAVSNGTSLNLKFEVPIQGWAG
jgi:hypothetical protein